jgi:hypothetical protein
MRQYPLLKWITAKSASAGDATQRPTVNMPRAKANRFIIASLTFVQIDYVRAPHANFDVSQRKASRETDLHGLPQFLMCKCFAMKMAGISLARDGAINQRSPNYTDG